MSCSITVFGCKNYEDVAKVFFKNINSNNTKLFDTCYFFSDEFIGGLNVNQLVINDEISWSMRVAQSLELIDSKFVFFLLDDYFLLDDINLHDYNHVVENCNLLDIKYCRLINNPILSNFGSFSSLSNTPYSINLQPAIWDRRFLINALRKIDSNPWVTETSLNLYFENSNGYYEGAVGFLLISSYLNGVIKGKWARDVPKCMIIDSKRLRMNYFEWYTYKIKSLLSAILSTKFKNILKIILSKIGFKFYS